MSNSVYTSPAAFRDCERVMDLALEKPGLRLEFPTYGAAVNFKQRCYKFRNLVRTQLSEQSDVPGFRAETAYDTLVILQQTPDGERSKRGTVLIVGHNEPPARIIDPETGEEIQL